MRGLYELRESLCKFTEEIARKGELSPGAIDMLDKSLNSIKNIYKIEMFEKQSNSFGNSYEESMDSYRRGYSREGGSYANYGENSYGSYGGGSYEEGNSGRRGYSRDSGKETMVKKMEEMLHYVDSEEQRKAIERCIHQIKEG